MKVRFDWVNPNHHFSTRELLVTLVGVRYDDDVRGRDRERRVNTAELTFRLTRELAEAARDRINTRFADADPTAPRVEVVNL